MGMRPYRPVSPRGRPRLTAMGEQEKTARVVTTQQQYKLQWSRSQSRVKNVPNVEKMRKFEPMRQHQVLHRSFSMPRVGDIIVATSRYLQ